MTEHIPKLMKTMRVLVQNTPSNSKKIHTKKTTPIQSIFKLMKNSVKEKSIKAARGKQHISKFRGKSTRMTTDLIRN